MSTRLEQLYKLLERNPNDPFLQYATALELKKAGDLEGAVRHLHKTLQLDADYLYAYYQQGQIEELRARPDAARAAYEEGIRRASARGDHKALGELRTALSSLDA